MFPDVVLDMLTGFRFPPDEILYAMKEIIDPLAGTCPWCSGGYRKLRDGRLVLCSACCGLGIKGGHGRKTPQVPVQCFEITRTELL
jgi:hypothetical protein